MTTLGSTFVRGSSPARQLTTTKALVGVQRKYQLEAPYKTTFADLQRMKIK